MATLQSQTLAQAVANPSLAVDVDVGSTIKGFYVEFNLNGVDNSGAVQVFHWAIMKAPAGDPSFDVDPSTYNTTKKRFIFKRGMEMLPQIPLGSGGTVQTKRVFFVALPPRFRRMGDADQVKLLYKSTSSSGVNFCAIVLYKEFK